LEDELDKLRHQFNGALAKHSSTEINQLADKIQMAAVDGSVKSLLRVSHVPKSDTFHEKVDRFDMIMLI
jgi:hypothetical protein